MLRLTDHDNRGDDGPFQFRGDHEQVAGYFDGPLRRDFTGDVAHLDTAVHVLRAGEHHDVGILMDHSQRRFGIHLEYAYPTVIFDIDGTLADNTHRGPFEWAKVSDDKPIAPIVALAEAADSLGYRLLFVSGREGTDQCRSDTLAWLNQHLDVGAIDSSQLFMRPEGDYRPDYEIKAEIADECRFDLEDIRYILDDRKQVVDMWRERGYTVLDVAGNTF